MQEQRYLINLFIAEKTKPNGINRIVIYTQNIYIYIYIYIYIFIYIYIYIYIYILRQLHKNVASNIEQVLAATPHKTPTIRPPASHHENYTS